MTLESIAPLSDGAPITLPTRLTLRVTQESSLCGSISTAA